MIRWYPLNRLLLVAELLIWKDILQRLLVDLGRVCSCKL